MTSQQHKHQLLFISFFTGIRGNCPAEWADDKIRVLEAEGRETLVLTGMGSHVANRPRIRYIKVPSLSWNDYKEELHEIKVDGETVPFSVYLFLPFAFIFGSVIDYFLRKLTKSISGGRWSWVITALPVAIWLKLRYRVVDVFCTGGPTSAHIVGGVIVFLTGGRLFCEFQDPLLGATMNRSSITRSISTYIEAWLVKHSTRAVYVTQEAARLARERNPLHAKHIVGVYPGAWQFVPPASPRERVEAEVFEFLHLGTLYGSRNLDLFFNALDALHDEGFELARSVHVINLGAVYCDKAPEYLARSDFQSLDALDRTKALRRAQKASCLLLVQHTDERSRETIPYKVYDYLNLRLPIFGLLNNTELKTLVETNGSYATQADDPELIKATLRDCLVALTGTVVERNNDHKRLDISVQFLKILRFPNE